MRRQSNATTAGKNPACSHQRLFDHFHQSTAPHAGPISPRSHAIMMLDAMPLVLTTTACWQWAEIRRSQTRHAELVSASIVPHGPAQRAEKWTLKQVQGDDDAEAVVRR
jgi:hypothetical protein